LSAKFTSYSPILNTGPVNAGSALTISHPDLVVSKQRLNQAKGIGLVKLKREERDQSLCFVSRPFILCGLPVRALPPGELLYERRNGRFFLQITGHPEFGVPYGQDRIVPIFLATLAVRQQSRVVRFRSAAEMLETFGMHKGGKQYRRLVSAFERIFGATIFFGTNENRSTARVVSMARFNFLTEAQIWYERAHVDSLQGPDDVENVVVLSEPFYQEINSHRVPTDLEAVKLFVNAPAVLDLFIWLSYRCYTARGEERIPLFGPGGLTTQLGSTMYSRERRFRAKLEQWLQAIRMVWSDCPAWISSDGLSLNVKHGASILRAGGSARV
jgi:replication initiator protein A